MSDNEAHKPKVDSTLSKGLAILEELASSRESRGVTDLSRSLNLTKSNTFRLLQTLTNLGYVRHEADKSYAATLKTWQIGRNVVENFNLRAAAQPSMRVLSQETGETIYLAVRDGLQVVYVDKIESQKPIRTWNPIGGTAPLFCVGTGKAILAAEYDELRELVLPKLQAFTDRTIVEPATLDADISATRKRGYAVDTGEFRPQVFSFGSAIRFPDGSIAGALGVSVPEVNMEEGDAARIGGLVLSAANSVSVNLTRL